MRKFLSCLLKKNRPRADWNVTSGQSVLSVNYNRLGNYGNNYHSPFVFIHRRGIVYHLFTAYNVYSNHWRSDEEKRNHSWLFAWFRVTRLGHRKPLLKGSASRSFSETVTYNWQMTLTCLSPSSICNDFICTRGHQLLWLREQNKHSCFHLCKYGNHSAMSFSLFCFLNLVPLKWSWKVTAVVAEVF